MKQMPARWTFKAAIGSQLLSSASLFQGLKPEKQFIAPENA